jgi:hypothetical protein
MSHQDDAALRVETKTPFLIFAKSENKRKFSHFSRNFSFSRKFSFLLKFLRKISQKILVFAKICHQCFGCGYTFRWLLNPDPHSEWKIFAQTFTKPKTFAKTSGKTNIFATKTKIFVSTLAALQHRSNGKFGFKNLTILTVKFAKS